MYVTFDRLFNLWPSSPSVPYVITVNNWVGRINTDTLIDTCYLASHMLMVMINIITFYIYIDNI